MAVKLGGRRFLLSLAITGASVCLALGITLPIIKLTKYVFWTTEHSLLSTVQVLINDGQIFLGMTILVFSIVFPVVKLLYLLLCSTLPQHDLVRMRPQLRAWCEANLRATERFELLGRRMVLYQRREIPFAAARP